MAKVQLASVDEVLPGETKLVPYDGRPPYQSIIVLNLHGSIRAYWNICQHVPIPLDGGVGRLPLVKGKLVCQTHGAQYRPEDGLCVHGPCEDESLEPIAVQIDAGIIVAEIE